MRQFSNKPVNIENAREAVKSTSQAGILDAVDRNGIPVSMNSSISAAGRYSFRVERAEDGRAVGVSNRKIELNPAAHANAEELGATFAHEAKHAEDEIGGEFGDFRESDRSRWESRAEAVERIVAQELHGRGKAA